MVDEIEVLIGLDFLTNIPDDSETNVAGKMSKI